MRAPAVLMDGISKRFGAVQANINTNFNTNVICRYGTLWYNSI